ncbi:signal recognition particle protein SRP54 [Pneumocystis carinii B80]|uniref:Signal recognition particle 54 kDa protein n=1 Tax=Pneumocystis carinii (strain B80) TaxID=1408658 RepID=A0A0W4ZN20_PNEC8|nr:signal recognition particle protein SRP54 [Pneumocystis carinii B80]KTW29755.1 signal recognition particle protein SRP54 [Pneumocystis carinii B80]
MTILGDLGGRISTAITELIRTRSIDENVLEVMLKKICSALLENDVSVNLVQNLRNSIKKKIDFNRLTSLKDKKRVIYKTVFDELCSLVDPNNEPYKPKKGVPNVILMVGLQGSGKTTSCAKLAHYYQQKGFKSCLVCADTFRAGSFDQLKQNAIKAKIPYFGSYTETDPVIVSRDGVEKFKKERFEIIIVDTSGRHRQEKELFKEMVQISNAIKPNQTIMVLDASIGQAAEFQTKAFKESVDFGAILITKMDGHAKGGGALSAVSASKTPIVFIGTGEHIYDLERFVPNSFISKLLGMGDVQGFMEHLQSLKLDQSKDTLKNIEKGIFTIRDLRDHLGSIMKMGPITKLLSMVPGTSQMMDGIEGSSKKFKKLIYIMDSMTEKELDSDGKIFITQPSRITRIAMGSGTSVSEVRGLLSQHLIIAGIAKRVGGKNGLAKNPNALKNSQQLLSIQKQLNSLGGSSGIPGMDISQMMKMTNQIMGGKKSGGFIPDFSNVMSQFGNMFDGFPDNQNRHK